MEAPADPTAVLFAYPTRPHVRKHGPSGYSTVESFKEWLRDELQFRCVYCLDRERWYPNGQAAFGVDHVKPRSLPQYQALLNVYGNLVHACNQCNALKRDHLLLDPCQSALADHVRLSDQARLEGLTPDGRRLVSALRLNSPGRLAHRSRYVRLYASLQARAEDDEHRALLIDLLGFPDDLPDLAALRPPANTRPEGLADCYHQQRTEGRLPAIY